MFSVHSLICDLSHFWVFNSKGAGINNREGWYGQILQILIGGLRIVRGVDIIVGSAE